MMAAAHVPVMLSQVMAALAVVPGNVIVDGTFGAGGYTQALLAAGATVIAFDRDPAAIAAGQRRFTGQDRLTLIQSPFGALAECLAERQLVPVDGVVFDLGVSSMQLDDGARGFSFRHDGPLDMRMSGEGPSAADLVNGCDEAVLADILYRFGEEKRSRAVARMIVARRQISPFERTLDLAEAIARVVAIPGQERIHPATRSFQALRIAVNGELDQLAAGLSGAEAVLKPHGRLAVVTFHSLEDRIVKRFLNERAQAANPSRHLPDVAAKVPSFILTRPGLETPHPAETMENPRARSAKLRSAIRSDHRAWPLERAALGLWTPEFGAGRGRRQS
ncbi:16S rRNA (cytosine(1402)-N(4))-methyltransferase RsmH [Candidatus Raskinella chloraquaticus]|uniref:Ribosomal RNA small subunit methyltransferase H n=1 Tax=Candidatus Raskinella chloraquaticus TaxID=1951219 RepID=A0A1W9HXT9_9HYPH|nr:MAG: hypothetical protein A4S15_08865 [Proteobacteria bacterium SG_bin8]